MAVRAPVHDFPERRVDDVGNEARRSSHTGDDLFIWLIARLIIRKMVIVAPFPLSQRSRKFPSERHNRGILFDGQIRECANRPVVRSGSRSNQSYP